MCEMRKVINIHMFAELKMHFQLTEIVVVVVFFSVIFNCVCKNALKVWACECLLSYLNCICNIALAV